MDHNKDKIDPNGRYIVVDSFSEEVERTNDFDYAKRRADSNDGWVTDDTREGRVVYDSED